MEKNNLQTTVKQLEEFLSAYYRKTGENAHFVAACHEIAELRIERGAAHMQRYDVRVRLSSRTTVPCA